MHLVVVLSILTAGLVQSSIAQTENNWLCGACRIMNHEISKRINEADDTQTTVVGSFRVDPKGNQKTVERKFKRSQLHIHEVMESVCGHMDDYGILTSAPAGKTDKVRIYQFVYMNTENGENSQFVSRTSEIRNKLKHKCDDILDEHEEWFESFFSKEVTPLEADMTLCLKKAGYCRYEDLAHSLYPPPIPVPKEETDKAEAAEEKSEL